MSAFLGPIHFWLYNKIQFQENLIDELVAYVTAKGWSDKVDQYVSTDRRKLDEVIDEANIHGWLQSRIHDAEGRYAALVLDAAGDDAEKFDALKEAARDFGAKQGLQAATAPEAFHRLDDLLLDGMPCDQVNRVRESTMPVLPGIGRWIFTVNFGRATATAITLCVRPWSTDSCRLRTMP